MRLGNGTFSHAQRMMLLYIDEEDVWGAINTLKYNKAPGLDRLPPELFKMLNQELVGFIQHVYSIPSVGLWDVLYLSTRKVMSKTLQIIEVLLSSQ